MHADKNSVTHLYGLCTFTFGDINDTNFTGSLCLSLCLSLSLSLRLFFVNMGPRQRKIYISNPYNDRDIRNMDRLHSKQSQALRSFILHWKNQP